MRPSDTGRSTNCLINDVGIYVHQKERGYHNYALPYSWDVRMGHKTRRRGARRARDELDMPRLRRILSEIGYDENRLTEAPREAALAAYFVASREVPDAELRRHLAETLPPALIPQYFSRVESIPAHAERQDRRSGAVRARRDPLPAPVDDDVAPEGAAQERIAAIWRDVLRTDRVGAQTSFFELGGTSLGAMETALRICNEFDVDLPLQTLFTAAHGRTARADGRRSDRRRDRRPQRRGSRAARGRTRRRHMSADELANRAADQLSDSKRRLIEQRLQGKPRAAAPRIDGIPPSRRKRPALASAGPAMDVPGPPGRAARRQLSTSPAASARRARLTSASSRHA